MHRLPLPFAFAVLTAALPAQQPSEPEQAKPKFDVRTCLPDDHRNIAVLDLAALRAHGVWDEIDVAPLNMVFAMIEKESGFRLADLDRLTMAMTFHADDHRVDRVTVLEGNQPLALAPSVLQLWGSEKLGEHEVRRRTTGWSDDICWQPRPELQVIGAAAILEPVLNGKPHSGRPCPDVMSLLSVRAKRLAWFVADVTHPLAKRDVLGALLSDTVWPADDAPVFVCLQLVATGDDDDPHLTVAATVRHGKDGAGVVATEAAVKAALERLARMPELRLVRPMLQAAVLRRDRCDASVAIDLGRARTASGFATLLFPWWLRAEPEAVIAAPAQALPAPAPADPQPKER